MPAHGSSDDPPDGSPSFRCTWRREAIDAASVEVSGELDIATSPRLEQTLDEALQGARLVLLNLGGDLPLDTPSDPLLAPPEDTDWQIAWSSQEPEYGGGGTPPFDPRDWRLTGESLIVLAPRARHEDGHTE